MAEVPDSPCPACHGTGRVIADEDRGTEMRMRRLERKLTVRRLAQVMGVVPSYICDLEAGRRRWKPAVIARYEAALEADEKRPSELGGPR